MNKLGEILVQKGYITQQQLDATLAVAGEEKIGQILIKWGFIQEQQLMEALDVQAPVLPPTPPAPPVAQPMYQQPVAPPPPAAPDLTMDNVQNSKFKIDLKTMIYIGSLLVSGVTMYFTFMSELDSRFSALEGQDKDLMVELDKRLVDLENKVTPIGEGVYTVDPNTTWPPSRNEYTMKQAMNTNTLMQIKEDIEDIKKDIEKIEKKVFNGHGK